MIPKRATLLTLALIFISLTLSAQLDNPLSILNKSNDYTDVPNTKIEFIPPAHFVYMEGAGGYLHIGTSSSVQVLEIKGTAYTMITPGLTEEYFKNQGVTLISEEDVITKDQQKAKLYTVSFTVEDVPFERLIFFTGDYNNTIWINANYPVAVKEMLNVVLKESLLSARFKQ